MKYLFLILLACVCFNLHAYPFKFVIKVPFQTGTHEAIYLTGDKEFLCHWEPDCLKLKMTSEGVYEAEIELSRNTTRVEFQITRGDWKRMAANGKAKALPNFVINPKKTKGEFVYSVVNWTDANPFGVTGNLVEISDVYSTELGNSRKIRVWVPRTYFSSPSKRFPVIYAHDGQNLFDPTTSAFGVDWAIDETLTHLIEQNEIREAIVVGLDSTVERKYEYDYFKKGHVYADFLIQTVKPYIDDRYRTLADRKNTYTMGSSMGALISFSLLWMHSDTFSRAAGISLPAFYDKSSLFNLIERFEKPTQPIHFYMDHGDSGGDAIYAPEAARLAKKLKSEGLSENNLAYKVYPWADHSEADWARRAKHPLKFLLE